MSDSTRRNAAPNDELREETERFLHALFGDLGDQEFINLRTFDAENRTPKNEFHKNIDVAVDHAHSQRDSHNVYVGVAPRHGRDGRKAGVERLKCIWGDL